MGNVTYIDQDQNLTMAAGADITLSGGGAVKGADIQAAAGSIGTTELADDAVTPAKLDDDADFTVANLAATALLAAAGNGAADAQTISGGVITPDGSASVISVTAEGAAADDLDTIATTNLLGVGTRIILENATDDVVTVKHGTGNIDLTWLGETDDIDLEDEGDTLALVLTAGGWVIDPAQSDTVRAWRTLNSFRMTKEVTIALGASSGSSANDADFVDAEIVSVSPISGNDQIVVGASIDGSGAVTVTVGGNETAEATFMVEVEPA